MIRFLLNILLMIVFTSLIGVSIQTLVIGFVLGNILLWWIPELPRETEERLKWPGFQRIFIFLRNLILFSIDFLKDLTLSNIQIAADIWSPIDHYNPEIIEVPVEDLTEFEVALLATRITLTPGTLSADVSADKKVLFVHAMYYTGPEQAKQLRAPIELLKKGLV